MKKPRAVSQLPSVPGLYALYGGTERTAHVAYIGITGNLRQRIVQHLINRDSSVATGTSAACLNPEHVGAVEWWECPEFEDKSKREAAEIIAFGMFDPVLRSRGKATEKAKRLLDSPDFVSRMEDIFRGEPTGRWVVPSLAEALDRIELLEEKVESLEKLLKELVETATSRK